MCRGRGQVVKDVKILKLGGSVITHKGGDSVLNHDVVRHIAHDVNAWLRGSDTRRLVLVAGGGSYGHPLAARYDINAPHASKDPLGFLRTITNMQRLGTHVARVLHEYEIPVLPIPPSSLFVTSGGRINESYLMPVFKALDRHLVPFLWGDAVFDDLHNCRILSGDQLVTFLAAELGAEAFLFASNVDGIYSSDPSQDPHAEVIPLVTDDNYAQVQTVLGASQHTDVTHGMWGKVEEIRAVPLRPVRCVIFNGLEPGYTYRALLGEQIGTTLVFTGDNLV